MFCFLFCFDWVKFILLNVDINEDKSQKISEVFKSQVHKEGVYFKSKDNFHNEFDFIIRRCMTDACNNEITVQNNYHEYYISFNYNMER